jgi:hypothetical protein
MGGAVRRRENPFRKRIILIGFNSNHALGACDASLAKNFSLIFSAKIEMINENLWIELRYN